MQRLVFYRDNLFTIRDEQGRWLTLLDRNDVDRIATQTEIREAIRQDEAAQVRLPEYDPDSGQYHWGDGELWDAEDVADDLRKLGWFDYEIPVLLDSAKLLAQHSDL
jgi:hypothetical protein